MHFTLGHSRLSAILRSRGTGRTHHAVGMRHCPRSEECKGINTSFPMRSILHFFDVGLGRWAMDQCVKGIHTGNISG